MKKILAGLALLSLLLGMAAPVWADDTGAVSATVTPKLISVSIDIASITYGAVNLSSTDNIPTETAPGSAEDPVITATNDGNVAEKLEIKGADATGDTTWNLVDGDPNSVGTDAYQHKFANDVSGLADLTPLPEDAGGNPAYTTLNASVSAAGSEDFKLRLDAPTGTTGYAERSTSVTVLATES